MEKGEEERGRRNRSYGLLLLMPPADLTARGDLRSAESPKIMHLIGAIGSVYGSR